MKNDNKLENKINKTIKGLDSKKDYLINIGANNILDKRILGNIYFDYNKYTLNNDNIEFIKKNILIIENTKIYLIGYSNEWGYDQYNIGIGLKRVQEVKEYLIKNGIDKNNIIIKTIGANHLICNDNIKECLEKNRKVEFKID
jgi:outer membrane protein OmpA-like peptidoglycan-associated protein